MKLIDLPDVPECEVYAAALKAEHEADAAVKVAEEVARHALNARHAAAAALGRVVRPAGVTGPVQVAVPTAGGVVVVMSDRVGATTNVRLYPYPAARSAAHPVAAAEVAHDPRD